MHAVHQEGFPHASQEEAQSFRAEAQHKTRSARSFHHFRVITQMFAGNLELSIFSAAALPYRQFQQERGIWPP
ncbi:hypothetical protein [Teichococcus rhizosphaerae]|uniref:hypothetical protein n=1 Tax=Teichococcus rhizosphaerae TaxID=1335062 RepID=UPI0011457323|nr:hypothetical protein [Pseudoroseomonas rhizosphaerae]